MWFIIISLVLFCLRKFLFSGFLKFKSNFVRRQDNSGKITSLSSFNKMLLCFSGFSGFIPQVPIQVLAVTGSASGASVVFHSHIAASLLAEGTNLASKLFGKFQTTSSQFQQQG